MTLTTNTTATTSFGRLRGTVDDGMVAFRGIPYAQPPLGPLRFAPPARLEGWSGTRSADRFGPAAMQTAGAALGERLVDETDEDCLSLNVWTPALDDRRRPVLVWLHGGGFVDRRRLGANVQRRRPSPDAAMWWSSPSTIASGSSATCAASTSAARPSRRQGTKGCSTNWRHSPGSSEEIAAFGGDPA